MKYFTSLIALSFFTLQACEFNKSINKNFSSGLSTIGDGLSCENVYLSIGEEKTSNSTFIYGETFYVNFNTIEGFKKEGNFVFPGMKLAIVGSEGDTIMQQADMYSDYADGIDISPLLLHANITVANPMLSNKKYTLYIAIWDKKGKGTFKAEMEFNIVPNDKITIESNNITYDNIYLFSEKDKITITDNKINLNDNNYLLFEGLKGFTEEDGKALIGLSINAIDAEKNVLINEEDLVGEEAMDITELNNQLAPNFSFTGTAIKTPINCLVTIWDKKSDAKITATFNLNLK